MWIPLLEGGFRSNSGGGGPSTSPPKKAPVTTTGLGLWVGAVNIIGFIFGTSLLVTVIIFNLSLPSGADPDPTTDVSVSVGLCLVLFALAIWVANKLDKSSKT
ncbi:MAG: hypothetical protein MN733_30560 [Nitrososphaera sp.]|nr:hypothetical protein [Nitrososphaera sp.]